MFIRSLISSLPVLGHMLRVDILTFIPTIKDRLIDLFIYASISVVVMGYLLTGFGMREDFGMFTASTLAVVSCIFEVFPRAIGIIMDLLGNKVITYDVTLPLPSWLAIARIGIADSMKAFFQGCFALPFGLLFVFHQFNPAQFSFVYFILMLAVSALFFGFFGLFLASLATEVHKLDSMWMRVIFPMLFLGGMQFTWQILYAKSPLCAYLALANPFLYAMEGMRAAVLGQAGSLPFWYCFVAVLISALLCGWIGVRRMMRRLDCV